MGQVVAVGTTGTQYASMMVSMAVKQAKARRKKWHCLCMMESGEEVFIVIKAETEAEASQKIHDSADGRGYKGVEYVLEILTSAELELRKEDLKPAIAAGISTY